MYLDFFLFPDSSLAEDIYIFYMQKHRKRDVILFTASRVLVKYLNSLLDFKVWCLSVCACVLLILTTWEETSKNCMSVSHQAASYSHFFGSLK